MRRSVDSLMKGGAAAPPRSAAAMETIRKARDKVAPFVSDDDRTTLLELIADLETSGTNEDETVRLEALERALRNHAYLL
jgi:hypothetical protein